MRTSTWLSCLILLAVILPACNNGPVPSDADSGADTGSDASGMVACGAPPDVDSSWFGGSLLYCGTGREPCGATATPTGPCWCAQEWSTDSTGMRCGGAIVAADRSHTYIAHCDPQTGVCRCSIDGDECYCRARPPRPCSDVCGPHPNGCLCGDTLPDGVTPRNLCSETCQDVSGLVECCADPDAPGSCVCWEPSADVCERSLNCCWTGGFEA